MAFTWRPPGRWRRRRRRRRMTGRGCTRAAARPSAALRRSGRRSSAGRRQRRAERRRARARCRARLGRQRDDRDVVERLDVGAAEADDEGRARRRRSGRLTSSFVPGAAIASTRTPALRAAVVAVGHDSPGRGTPRGRRPRRARRGRWPPIAVLCCTSRRRRPSTPRAAASSWTPPPRRPHSMQAVQPRRARRARRSSAFASCSASQRPAPRDGAAAAAIARRRAASPGGAASAAATATPVRSPATAGTPGARRTARPPRRRAAPAASRPPCTGTGLTRGAGEDALLDRVPALGGVAGDAGRAVVEHEHVPDRGSSPTRADQVAQRLDLAPDHRRVVERVGRPWRPRAAARAAPRPCAGASGGRSSPRRSASSAPSPESPPEHVRIARPPDARARAAHRQRLGQLEQLVDVGRPGRARLLHQRAEDAVVAGHRAGVRGRRGRAGRRGADLQHRDADPGVGADGQRLAQPRAVALGLDEQRDRAHALGSRARCSTQSGVVTTASLPHEIAVCSRSPRRVASALTTRLPLCETSATWPGCGAASASPHSAARECSEISPSQFGPQTGSECRPRRRRATPPRARRPPERLAEARAVHDRAAAAEPARLLDHRGTPAAGIATTTASGADGQVGERREARPPVDRRAARVDAPHLALEAQPPQVQQRLRGVGRRRARWRRRRRPSAGCSSRCTLVKRPLHPAALQRARHDQPLDLARALPDAVDAQLAQEALGDVGAHVAAPAEHLHRAVGAAVRGLGDEQLRHRRLGVHDLRVGALVGEPRDLERQRAPGRGVGRRVGQRERHALVVHDPRAALLARQRPRRRLVEQPPHRADAARGDPDPLLGEPRALQVVASRRRRRSRASSGDPTLVEADRRMPVRIGVRERRVVDDLDARRTTRSTRNSVGPESVSATDDVDRRHVAVGDEPLLAVDAPSRRRAARRVVAICDGSDPASSSVTA